MVVIKVFCFLTLMYWLSLFLIRNAIKAAGPGRGDGGRREGGWDGNMEGGNEMPREVQMET